MSKDKKIAGVSGTFTIDDTAQILPNDNKGWICPICGRGVAPNVKVCPCKSEPMYVPYPIYSWIYPSYPEWWKKITVTSKPNITYTSNTDYTPSNTHTTTTLTNGEK